MASDKDTIIKVTNAAVRFNMASERIDNLKEYFVKLIKREPASVNGGSERYHLGETRGSRSYRNHRFRKNQPC